MASGQNDLFVIFDASSSATLTLAYHVPRYLDSETEHARTSTSLSLHHFTIHVALQPGLTFPTKNTFRRTRVVPASTFGDSFTVVGLMNLDVTDLAVGSFPSAKPLSVRVPYGVLVCLLLLWAELEGLLFR